MKRDPLLYGVIGILIGGIVVWFMAMSAVNNNNTSMMQMMGMNQNQQMMGNQNEMMEEKHDMDEMGMDSSMDDMMVSLKGKMGDDFDKAFLSSMIVHHQGAIDMANEAKINAKHDEIKSLADDIITAQEKEIKMMMEWQNTWGY